VDTTKQTENIRQIVEICEKRLAAIMIRIGPTVQEHVGNPVKKIAPWTPPPGLSLDLLLAGLPRSGKLPVLFLLSSQKSTFCPLAEKL